MLLSKLSDPQKSAFLCADRSVAPCQMSFTLLHIYRPKTWRTEQLWLD